MAYAKGDHNKGRAHRIVPAPQIDVKRVPRKFGLSQNDFAENFGINAATCEIGSRAVVNPTGLRGSCCKSSIGNRRRCSEF